MSGSPSSCDSLTAQRLHKKRARRQMNDSRSFDVSSVELHAESIPYKADDGEGAGGVWSCRPKRATVPSEPLVECTRDHRETCAVARGLPRPTMTSRVKARKLMYSGCRVCAPRSTRPRCGSGGVSQTLVRRFRRSRRCGQRNLYRRLTCRPRLDLHPPSAGRGAIGIPPPPAGAPRLCPFRSPARSFAQLPSLAVCIP